MGLVYHSDKSVFGPALIDAYKLESEVAVYPRILFGDDVVDSAQQFRPRFEDPKNSEEYSKECCLLMRRDFDGLYHLDFLNEKGLMLGIIAKHQGPSLEKMREIVQEMLKVRKLKPNIRAKWEWTLRYITTEIESVNLGATF